MSSPERYVRHIIERFPMYGLGNSEAAILQCAKELLQNSFDALKDIEHFTTTRGAVHLKIKCNDFSS